MKAVLSRTGSVPVHLSSYLPGSPRVSISTHDIGAGFFSGERSSSASPRISLNVETTRRSTIRKALSEPDMIAAESEIPRVFRSRSFPARIPEEEYASDCDDEVGGGGVGSLVLSDRAFDQKDYDWPRNGIPLEEVEFSGGGNGKGRLTGGGSGGDDYGIGGFSGGNADRGKIGAYYLEMLKSNPTNSLLLRNYAKFLHEVEMDTSKAEEYYGRAILASPGDGEVLSLYGKLIWETQRDEDRAKSYFDLAVYASPHDCAVLGSYAHFMWEAEDEEDEAEEETKRREVVSAASMVEAF
ncbi:hypothetical protein RJ639_000700 [Escallonia herrerae]|uniref:TmcB/TmcC TPR repeats domain-containing protein n=1 Tax=Escallonia herrerae TaxID=1293975 RepID=A0AA89BRR8_9ASTE|nr:hypothetical protein RJ639_000700 [Escallonia herrerae]